MPISRQRKREVLTLILAMSCLAVSWYFAIEFAAPATFHLPHGLINDLYIPWNASRAMLRHIDPYSDRVTEQNQQAAFGGTAQSLHEHDERRFAYPVYAAFPFIPLALMDFDTANNIAFWVFALLAALSVGWLRGTWDRDTAVYCILFFASYPLILALQVRQPTILFLALGIAGFHLLSRGQPVSAGLAAALSTGKPQVALPIVLPMLIWACARWRQCKSFVLSFIAGCAVLVSVSSITTPPWIAEWMAALRSYIHYGAPSLVNNYFGDRMGFLISAMIALVLTLVLWLSRNSDLLFLSAISVVVWQFLLPVFMYSQVILLIPAVWVARDAALIKSRGDMSQLTLAVVRIAFIEFWLATAIGAILLHTNTAGKAIAWQIGQLGIMIFPMLWSLLAMIVLQLGAKIFTAQHEH